MELPKFTCSDQTQQEMFSRVEEICHRAFCNGVLEALKVAYRPDLLQTFVEKYPHLEKFIIEFEAEDIARGNLDGLFDDDDSKG